MVNIITIMKMVLETLLSTYFFALFWYRFSDQWQSFLNLDPDDDEQYYFVNKFDVRPIDYSI